MLASIGFRADRSSQGAVTPRRACGSGVRGRSRGWNGLAARGELGHGGSADAGPPSFRGRFGHAASGYSRVMRLAVALVPVFLVVLPAAHGSTRKAHIAMVSTAPVIVGGTGFRANERVSVTVSAKTIHKKVVVASRL